MERLLARAVDANGILQALTNVRSRRGLERLDESGLLTEFNVVQRAIQHCTHPVTFAMLSPLAPACEARQIVTPIEPISLAALAKAQFRSSLHLGIIEVVRRSYKRQAMEIDRLDKQAKVKALNNQKP